MENAELKKIIWDSGEIRFSLRLLLSELIDRLTALERGETHYPWTCPICFSELDFADYYDHLKTHRPPIKNDGECERAIREIANPTPAPTPATVERFTAYKFEAHRVINGSHDCLRHEIGTVVATPDGEGGWLVKLPDWRHWVCLTDNAYRALVDMMLKSGVWERQV